MAAAIHAAGEADRPQQITRVVRADPRTGKLVRTVIVTAKPAGSPRTGAAAVPSRPAATATPVSASDPSGINEAVERIAARQSLPPQLVHSVIKVESNYNALAVSPKGAQGMMQLMPNTARRFGVSNSFDPIDNIEGGAKYLKYLLDLYKGDYGLALAAYNAGEGAVEKYGTVPPYPETRNYLMQINQLLRKNLPAVAESKPAEPKPVVEEKPDSPAHIHGVVGPDGSIHYTSR